LSQALTKVSDSIFAFDGKYPGGGNVTSAVFRSGREAIVFDSLLYPDDTRTLLHRLSSLNFTIKGLVNTHWHVDHTAGNQLFHETNRIISHSLCSELMHTSSQPDWANETLELEEKDRITPTYPNEVIVDRSKLYLGESELEFLHTPGHTPDSVIGWKEDESVIIAGDTVMELPFVGYGDSGSLIDSLKLVQSIAGKSEKIIQGHGGICGAEKLSEDIRYIECVRKRTAEYIGSGKTVEQASEGVKLEECFSKERAKSLADGYGSLFWCHPSNVERIYSELKGNRA